MNRQQRRAKKNTNRLRNAPLGVQYQLCRDQAFDVVIKRAREDAIQRTVIALHEAFGFSNKRIQQYADAMRDVNAWMDELVTQYMDDARTASDRKTDENKLLLEAQDFAREKLRELAQKYTDFDLQNWGDIR
ncbi:MAG: hypothetical protein ACI4PQ_08685 [Butyricicoccaceae bacterium]